MRHVRGYVDGEYQDGELRGLSFLAGKRGMGKTTEMVRLLSLCRGVVIFFDTLSKHNLPNFHVVNQPGELKALLRQARRGSLRVHYQPIGRRFEHFEAVNAIVKAVGWMIYAIDEIDLVCKKDADGDAPKMPPGFKELVEAGRHFRVSMLFTARKPPAVPRGLTSECLEFRLFRTTENRYVRYWAETIGDDATAARLRTLPKYQYLLCRDGEEPVLMSAGKKIF